MQKVAKLISSSLENNIDKSGVTDEGLIFMIADGYHIGDTLKISPEISSKWIDVGTDLHALFVPGASLDNIQEIVGSLSLEGDDSISSRFIATYFLNGKDYTNVMEYTMLPDFSAVPLVSNLNVSEYISHDSSLRTVAYSHFNPIDNISADDLFPVSVTTTEVLEFRGDDFTMESITHQIKNS